MLSSKNNQLQTLMDSRCSSTQLNTGVRFFTSRSVFTASSVPPSIFVMRESLQSTNSPFQQRSFNLQVDVKCSIHYSNASNSSHDSSIHSNYAHTKMGHTTALFSIHTHENICIIPTQSLHVELGHKLGFV